METVIEKSRKPYQGQKNNKERTMKKLLLAVGSVLEQKGYTGLTITNIAKEAKTDRKLIPLYFGTIENLIETYIKQKDYWVTSMDSTKAFLQSAPPNSSKYVLKDILFEQLNNFANNKEMQKAVAWQISEHSEIMSQITREREKVSNLFFELSDKELHINDVDLRAITGILVSGIYYLVLHSENTDSTFCEIELNENGFERIKNAIEFILDSAYSKRNP